MPHPPRPAPSRRGTSRRPRSRGWDRTGWPAWGVAPPLRVWSRKTLRRVDLSVNPLRSREASRGRRGLRASTCLLGLSACSHVFQEPPHDFPAPRLRQRVGEANGIGAGELADFLVDVRGQRLFQFLARLLSGLDRHEDLASPLSSSGRPTAAASATEGWLTSALSISAVPMR